MVSAVAFVIELETHRLFAACPIPEPSASALAEWAAATYRSLPVRLVPVERMHVTLLFFPAVEASVRDELVGLTRQVEWRPIAVETGSMVLMGRSAIVLHLEASADDIRVLEDRLVRASTLVPEDKTLEQVDAEHDRLANEPLGRMAFMVGEPENEKKRRRQRHGRSLALHVTLARARSPLGPKALEAAPAPMVFTLDRLVLYESILGPSGPRYELLASAGSGGSEPRSGSVG